MGNGYTVQENGDMDSRSVDKNYERDLASAIEVGGEVVMDRQPSRTAKEESRKVGAIKEVIGTNGGYNIKKVSEAIPSSGRGIENCITVVIVEVFCEFSWKIAANVKTMDCKKQNISNKIHLQAVGFQNQYLVRLIACSNELIKLLKDQTSG